MKIWDLRQGHILYSLYGHEGPANTVSFSPNGDFFSTSGTDSIIMCWKSNLNEVDTEIIDDLGGKNASAQSHRQQPQSAASSARAKPQAPSAKGSQPASARGAAV